MTANPHSARRFFPLMEKASQMYLLTTPQASDYLREKHGIVRAPATLNKLRTVGGGPKFRRVGRRHIFYVPVSLDEWATSVLSEEMDSTALTPVEQKPTPLRRDKRIPIGQKKGLLLDC